MNKFKKLAMAAVSVIMAGSMVFSFTACGKDKPDNPTPDNPNNPSGPSNPNTPGAGDDFEFSRGDKPTLDASLTPKVDDNDLPSYSEVTLKTSIGYSGAATGITYRPDEIRALAKNTTASNTTLAGTLYQSGDLKPAWKALSTKLGITIEDDWVTQGGIKASENITKISENSSLSQYGLITASAETIVTEQSKNETFLDLSQYLYYMPNYKAFLDQNPIVRLSLTANASTGAMYMLPYFDGNNDIEKYVLMRKDIVEKLLNTTDLSAATGTFAQQATAKNGATNKGVVTVEGTKSTVTSFMGRTEADNYTIAVTDPSVMTGTPAFGNDKSEVTDPNKTVDIVVDYGAALTAAKSESTGLGAAIKDAAGAVYNEASGNIVDLQNFAINKKSGAVTGAQLTKILQEYIKVAYHLPGQTAAFYTNLSDVFNSAYAAWDVDLYVALGRCAVTSTALLGDSVKDSASTYFLGSRLGSTNRTYDIASMAGELYGVRGLTSRYSNLYTYINNEGESIDARSETAMWDALANMSALAKEGLYYTGTSLSDGVASIANSTTNTNVQILSSTDYVQTQTAKGGFVADGTISGNVEQGYNYAPILTPVSRWDVDGDGTSETVMRFTESWRAVKSEGFCVVKSYVTNNPERLAAVLALIDYFYSNDGQMLMTYGPQSTNGNSNANGTWYATKASKTLDEAKSEGIVDTYDGTQYFVKEAYKSQYFCYNNELYTGTFYNGKQIPTMTDENLGIFYDVSKQNFTNHARYYLGTALNLGVKDQGFEYQCTSTGGIVGADIWAIANVNGTIKHTVQNIDVNNMWYTLTPTTLPFTDAQNVAMADEYKYVSGKGGSGSNFIYAASSCYSNLLTDIMYYGYDTSVTISVVGTLNLKIPANAQGIITMLNSTSSYGGLSIVDGYMNSAWLSLLTYYTQLTK